MAQEVESFSFSPSDRVEAALLVVRTLRPSIWASHPLDTAALTKCKKFSSAFPFSADPQKGRFISAHSASQSESPKNPQTREGFPPAEMFSSEEHRVEVVVGVGGVRGSRVQSP